MSANNTATGTFSTLLAEDEPWARELMVSYIQNRPELALAAIAKDGQEALQAIMDQEFELAFLDINLPSLTGIELIKEAPKKPYIIFVTVSKDYALEAFDIGAVDYLLKPVSIERFHQAVDKALLFLSGTLNQQSSGEAPVPEPSQSKRLFRLLQADYGLTYQESLICSQIYEGLDRDAIIDLLGIKKGTMKFHLKSIFAKTIDQSGDHNGNHSGKLQRLTVFLYKLLK
ncbi:MAG: response regulator [Leptospiraceae bacterium]|nr:response regulator [Leptospiraceae bacterium]